MKVIIILCICFAFLVQSLWAKMEETGLKAHCDLSSTTGNFLGKIEINEVIVDGVKAVEIKGNLNNVDLPDGAKGFHIHQFGKTGNDCLDAGPHFNPDNMQHGSPLDHTNRHLGDMGNVYCQNKTIKLNILDSRLKMTQSETDKYGILGRCIVLHKLIDNLGRGTESDSKTTGAAGGRYACCVINPN